MTEPAFLLDSNICIYLLGGLSGRLRDRIECHAPGKIITSSIVYVEVMRKVDPDDRVAGRKATAFFSIFPVLPFDAAAALAYRSVPFRRASFDRLIAAHTLALKLTLVSNNEADFADVPGLRLENWTR